MRKRDMIWITMALMVLLTTAPCASWAAGGLGCTWGISTLRGDAIYPPGWQHLGGTLDVRRPFVRLYSDGTRLFIKGFEFEVRNSSTTGENNDPNPLIQGVMGVVASYLPPETDERVFQIIPHTHIFEKGAADYFQVQYTPGINSDFVRLMADIPEGKSTLTEYYIPAGAGDLALLVVYRGTFETQTPMALGLGSYFFDQELQHNSRLAFYRQYGGPGTPLDSFNPSNVFTILPSGEDLRDITGLSSQIPQVGESFTAYFDPAWSPDGARLAMEKEYCAVIEDQLPSEPIVNEYCSSENFMNDVIIIDQSSGPPNPEVPAQFLRINYSDFPQFDNQTQQRTSLQLAAFSPDGKKLVCVDELVAIDTLWLFDLESSNLAKNVIGGFEQDEDGLWRSTAWRYKELVGSAPVWRPEGDIISYSYHDARDESEEKRNIHTINLNGTQDTAVTDDEYFNSQPTWSPDGNWLAFISNRSSSDPSDKENGAIDIWVMDRNGQNKIRVYDGADSCWTPSFSPDGTRIAFSLEGRICSVNLSGQDFKTVYERPEGSPDLVHSVKWSPYLNAHTPTVTLEANALVVVRNGSNIPAVTLTWDSSNADRIVINNGVGQQASMSGSTYITPLNLEVEAPYVLTYTVAAYNWAGKASASIYIKVIEE